MKTILSLKAQENVLKVVQDFTIENGKTKDLSAILKTVLPRETRKSARSSSSRMTTRS